MMMTLAEFPEAAAQKSVGIEFTRPALIQWNLMRKLSVKRTGFVIGSRLGKYRFIENFFAIECNQGNLDRLYQDFFQQFGERLMGVFFINSDYFLDDWFLENIIIRLNEHGSSVFWYHLDQPGEKKLLEKIL